MVSGTGKGGQESAGGMGSEMALQPGVFRFGLPQAGTSVEMGT